MNIILINIIYLSVLTQITNGENLVITPSNPKRNQGCRLEVTCTDEMATNLQWFEVGNNIPLSNDSNIQIVNSAFGSQGFSSVLTFNRLMGLGESSYRCDSSSGETFSVSITVEEPIMTEAIPDLSLNRYVEGQGYFVAGIVQSCVWPVELEWEKDGASLFTQTLTAEETGEISTRAGLFDTTLDTESVGTYRCTASVSGNSNSQEFTMSGVVQTAD